jgi:RNA-directed DNA polymerase
LLTQLTTYERHLPQGAPTSPALANLLLASIYGPVLEACAEKNIVVTAWVDDLIFSGDQARSVMELVRKTLAERGFALSPKKRQVLGSRTSKVITGVRIGDKKVRACKEKIADVRAGIHNIKCGRVTSKGAIADMNRLRGQIAYINSLCPEDAAPLSDALGRLQKLKGFSKGPKSAKGTISSASLSAGAAAH